MTFYNHFRTLVFADVHLGTCPESLQKLVHFLKFISSDRIIFSGDMAKGWELRNNLNVSRHQNFFIQNILEEGDKNNSAIYFLNEASDKMNEQVKFGRIAFAETFSFSSAGKKFLCLPGSLSNHFGTGIKNNSPEWKYSFLLWMNKRFNNFNLGKKGYKSLFKSFNLFAQNDELSYLYLSRYKSSLIDTSEEHESEGIICPHMHFPGIYYFAGISYLNPGFWSESLTALGETKNGVWQVLSYAKMVEEIEDMEKHRQLQEKLFAEQKIENYAR